MKVYINDITDEYIHCSTEHGTHKVKWNGNKPEINSFYHVEPEITDILQWNKDIELSQENDYYIMSDENITMINGLLESIDKDGYALVRIGDDIIPFTAKGSAFKVGSRIKMCIRLITAYPVTY